MSLPALLEIMVQSPIMKIGQVGEKNIDKVAMRWGRGFVF